MMRRSCSGVKADPLGTPLVVRLACLLPYASEAGTSPWVSLVEPGSEWLDIASNPRTLGATHNSDWDFAA